MKKLLFALLIIPVIGFAQIPKPQSKIESISSKSGMLLKKEYKRIGSYYYGYVETLKITNISTAEVIKGVRVGGGKSWSFLDDDELDGLIFSLEKIKGILNTSIPLDYTEYLFTSRGGLEVAIFSDKSKWNFSITTDKYLSSSTTTFFEKAEQFQSFYDLVVTAKAQL